MSMHPGYAIGELTIIAISGADRIKIANNLCTQDLRSLESGQVCETFVTDVKGRTLSHGLMWGRPDEVWFVSSPGQGERLVPHIDRYIIREDAQVRDASSEWHAFLFLKVEDAMSLLDTVPSPGSIEALSVPWIAGGGLLLVSTQNAESAQAIEALTAVRGACTLSDCTKRDGWERQRIEAFWPWYGVDIDDRNLPQEASIDARAISFKKGCYLGQETVARLDALGQVQKRMVQLVFESVPNIELPYTIEADGKEVGRLTSLAATEQGGVGLAMVRRGHFAAGTWLDIAGHRAQVQGP
jgi:folate-binding protein YgfZ